MPDFVITLPVVESAAFSVNPVATKGSTTITVAVKEITKTVYPEERYAGEFYSGECFYGNSECQVQAEWSDL